MASIGLHHLVLSPASPSSLPTHLFPGNLTSLRVKKTLNDPRRTRRPSSVFIVRSSLPPFPDSDPFHGLPHDLLVRVEGLLYTLADVAAAADTKKTGDWLSGITNYLETVLKVLKDGLSVLHVPYSYGFAIILLTVLVKAATFPLTKKQVESSLAMRSLQPQVKAIQQRHAGDQERIQLETARLYKLAGINPLAGCLPTLATIPVWIGLYRALSNVADEGLLTEGFFWIPTLAGPTTIAARQSGSGISWLFPFVDGHPPLGWSDTLAYLVLPVLLIVSQYISAQIMQTSQANDTSQKNSQALMKLLPLLIGYFALSVPSGLSLYWLTNNVLSTAQQVWLQKLGGAKNPVRDLAEKPTLEKSDSQKSILDVEPPKVEVRQVEMPSTTGLKPGDRFKQLKEQEAKRRQEREQKRKAEEEAKRNNEKASEVDIVEGKDEQENAELPEDDNEALKYKTSVNDHSAPPLVNGTHSVQELKEDFVEKRGSEDDGPTCNGNSAVVEERISNQNLQKDEVADSPTSVGIKQSIDFNTLNRREQSSNKDDS
ncbi:hypothetical protein QJS10_CPA06g01295 [Acorus calamus]|uniref:Membrane insertase YidC/Oxa/ALB C-terminal domain-containing protein n=1 Tax=Acorus calamus TaxID=4465 RepID=A0AAV9EMY1_ACOCL|nr:hypothetical protein QJS10_CPA06g01295 [Acorus calamus]